MTPRPRTSDLSPHHLEQLLDAVMYRIGPDIRRDIMRDVPAAYNAYVGREVVRVLHTSDGTPC